MRSILLHNKKAGAAESQAVLLRDLAQIGWTVTVCDDIEGASARLVRGGVDVVIAAGGDGTVGKVAKRLAGTEMPMAIVPMGTLNNVAHSLKIPPDPSAVIAGLAQPIERRIDLGLVQGADVREHVLEALGVGLFAYALGERVSKKHKKQPDSLRLLADELVDYAPRRVGLEVDGRDLSGDFLVASIMNAKRIGPGLPFAPDASFEDGELDVVLVRPESRAAMVAHLRHGAENGAVTLPPLETLRAKHVRLHNGGDWAHLDDTARELHGEVTVDVARGAVRLLAPGNARGGA